jgi:hypothetical protein
VNRHPDTSARWKLKFGDEMNPAGAKVTILSGDSPEAFNDVAQPNRVVPETRALVLTDGQLELPPHSVAIAQFGS